MVAAASFLLIVQDKKATVRSFGQSETSMKDRKFRDNLVSSGSELSLTDLGINPSPSKSLSLKPRDLGTVFV